MLIDVKQGTMATNNMDWTEAFFEMWAQRRMETINQFDRVNNKQVPTRVNENIKLLNTTLQRKESVHDVMRKKNLIYILDDIVEKEKRRKERG